MAGVSARPAAGVNGLRLTLGEVMTVATGHLDEVPAIAAVLERASASPSPS